ncbi:MAG: hypothetical protein HKN45_10490 [Flavobacteriales bacterium]|nr:hypothetical protein [Flavobacteriales bacterium]
MTRLPTIFLILSLSIGKILFGQIDSTYRIQGFAIEGNKKTKEWLIIRECGYNVGDSILESQINETALNIQVNLINMQLFATANVIPIPLPNNEVMFLITVAERWYFYPIPVVQLAEPNFNVWWRNRAESRTNYGIKFRQYNFRGRREKISLTAKFGYAREFRLGYNMPYLIKDKNWGFNIGIRYKENEEITTGTVDNERTFFTGKDSRTRVEQFYSIGTIFRPDIFQTHSVTLAYDNVQARDSVSILFPDHLTQGNSRMKQLRLVYQFSKNDVDRRGYPLKGYSYRLRAEKQGLGILTKSADIFEIQGFLKKYLPIGRRWTTQHSLSAKTTFYNELPYFLQRGLGYGSESVRSYEFYIMDGQHYFLSRNNLNFNLIPEKCVRLLPALERMFPETSFGIYMNLIFDMGYVEDNLYAEQNPLNNELLFGTGLGLDIVSNYDYVFRFEYTVNRLMEPGFFIHYRKGI